MPGTPIPTDWVPEAALLEINAERATTNLSDVELTRKIFRQNSPLAAKSICQMAVADPNPYIRLKASCYVVERVLGRIGEEKSDPAASTPVNDFVSEISEFLEGKAEAAQDLKRDGAVVENLDKFMNHG